ncbi:hypothetical protein JCM11491_007155 [Sporobolomyces phaffii]
MQHPVQALSVVDSLVVSAVDCHLSCFDLATSTEVSTATPHSALIRLVATYTDPTTRERFVVSTGEDKQLVVSTLPGLEQKSTRELVKRANALAVTAEGEIVVGDKFGDVYTFPLDPPLPPVSTATATTTTDEAKKTGPEYLPVLGHVSMLNAMALFSDGGATTRRYIATGDRDEHVRVSRFPLGHVVEGFLWGSKHFVSSLLYVPAPPPSSSTRPLLLSAGGDATVQVFALELPDSVGHLVAQYEVASVLLPHVAVAPELPEPVPAGRKKDKKGKHKSNDDDAEDEDDGEAEDADGAAAAEGGGAQAVVAAAAAEQDNDTKGLLKSGLAVIKMVQVGTEREHGGVIVLAAGCTALLYIPFSSLLSPSPSAGSDRSHTVLELPHPILDFVPVPTTPSSSSSSSFEYLVSLDTTRSRASPSSSSPSPASSSPCSIVRVSLDPAASTFSRVSSSSSGSSEPRPNHSTEVAPSVASLYPVLMMLHHPGDEAEFADRGGGASTVGDGKPKGGVRLNVNNNGASGAAGASSRGKKRTSAEAAAGEEDDDDVAGAGGAGGRNNTGKRAVGRAETLRRWEEAKRKLEEEGKGQDVTTVTTVEDEIKVD